jgi:hypothetical protein
MLLLFASTATCFPLLLLPFPAPSLVGCCIVHHCSSPLHPPPLASPLLPLPFQILMLVGCWCTHRCSSSLLDCTACFPLATVVIPHSITGWLLHQALLQLRFASTGSLLPSCFLCDSLLHHWLVAATPTAAPPSCFC